MCWWCYWGWPSQIADIYNKALHDLNGYSDPLHFGPAHIVWEDENWDFAQSCLDKFDSWVTEWNDGMYDEGQLEIVRQSLVDLIQVPEEFKIEPEGYDDANPQDFPPPSHWVMVKI